MRLKKGSQASVIIESLTESLGLDYELIVSKDWGQASPDGSGNPMGTLFMLAAFFAILYFLLIRPQRQQW